MPKLQKIKFKFKKDSNQVEVWDREVLLKTINELELENFLTSFVENINRNKSNIIPFERKSLL